jgi:hypothetical protein
MLPAIYEDLQLTDLCNDTGSVDGFSMKKFRYVKYKLDENVCRYKFQWSQFGFFWNDLYFQNGKLPSPWQVDFVGPESYSGDWEYSDEHPNGIYIPACFEIANEMYVKLKGLHKTKPDTSKVVEKHGDDSFIDILRNILFR